jgi:hypothetical protein
MAYGQRDKFIQAVVTFTTSDQAKEMSPIELQGILAKIRDKYSPEVTNDDWGEIAQGVNDFKFVIVDSVKYKEVPNIENQLPDFEATSEPEPEPAPEQESTPDITAEQIEKTPEVYNESEQDGETLEDDFEEEQREKEPEPQKPEKFGRFIKPKENKPIKVNTTRLKGLLKPKKTND